MINCSFIRRRDLIKLGMAGIVFAQMPNVFAKTKIASGKKLVWIVLRGAMDSLHALVPTFAPELKALRAPLLNAIATDLLPLESGYALHPALKNLHAWYHEGSFSPVVAVATSYRERSHFSAQDLLESGNIPIDHDSGWLARALLAYRGNALVLARSIPISLRGEIPTNTWYPSTMPEPEEDIYERLLEIYKSDSSLHQRLRQGLQNRLGMSYVKPKINNIRFSQLAAACGKLLCGNTDTDCAMLEFGGWDTHNAQVNRLEHQFRDLDSGLGALRNALGDDWENTVVVVATEFGRTVAINGTGGTDHGTASVLFLAGGAINGGKIYGDWPGLAPSQLYEGRDLNPTSDVRAWISRLLNEHWSLNEEQLQDVFAGVAMRQEYLVRARSSNRV